MFKFNDDEQFVIFDKLMCRESLHVNSWGYLTILIENQ